MLQRLAAQGAEIRGVAVHDNATDLGQFLAANGNPYAAIGSDPTSGLQLSIGSSGVPESFVIDGKGVIRYQHIGDIRADDVAMLIQRVKEACGVPTLAYQVSGEYSMIQAAAGNGWIDGQKAALESLLVIKRAGADGILTYFAPQIARSLRA